MNKNVLIASLALTTLVSGSLAFWFAQERGTLQVGLAAQTAARVEATHTQTAAAEASRAELAALQERLRQSEETVRDLRGEVSLLQAGRSRGPALNGRPGRLPIPRDLLAELLGKPETVGLALDWIKADQSPRYAALIARQTQLTGAQREELRGLLAERYATRMDLSAVGADGVLSPDQKRELDAEYHQKLVALVGPEEAELFERVETKPISAERLQRLDERLRYEAAPLDRDQYAALWPVLSSGVFYFKTPTDQAGAAELIQQRTEANAKVLAGARSLLQPAQYQALERLLHEDTVTWQIQLEQATRMRAAFAKRRGQNPAPEK